LSGESSTNDGEEGYRKHEMSNTRPSRAANFSTVKNTGLRLLRNRDDCQLALS
jgi:hypothetical protein